MHVLEDGVERTSVDDNRNLNPIPNPKRKPIPNPNTGAPIPAEKVYSHDNMLTLHPTLVRRGTA